MLKHKHVSSIGISNILHEKQPPLGVTLAGDFVGVFKFLGGGNVGQIAYKGR
jgi:hypothetical protein